MASPRYDRSTGRTAALAVTIAVHVVLVAALWQVGPVRTAVLQHVPVFAQIITPARLAPSPPHPQSVQKHPPTVAAKRAPPALQRPPEVAEAPPAPAPVVSEVPAPAPPAIIAAPAPAPAPAAAPAIAAAPAVTPPRFDADYLRNPPPEYPAFARRRGEEGRVLLRVHVASDGTPREIEVKTSSGSERLDRAALDAVKRWKFVPARVGDAATDAWVLVPIAFSLAH